MKINNNFPSLSHYILSNDFFLLLLILLVFLFLFVMYRGIRKYNNLITIKLGELSTEITKEIKSSVQSKFVQLSPEADVLIQIAIDHWRLNKKVVDNVKSLSEKEKQTLQFSLERIKTNLSKFDIEIKDYTNEKYYEGLNVDIISVEKHKHSSDNPIILDTIDPGVIIKGMLVKKAKVVIAG